MTFYNTLLRLSLKIITSLNYHIRIAHKHLPLHINSTFFFLSLNKREKKFSFQPFCGSVKHSFSWCNSHKLESQLLSSFLGKNSQRLEGASGSIWPHPCPNKDTQSILPRTTHPHSFWLSPRRRLHSLLVTCASAVTHPSNKALPWWQERTPVGNFQFVSNACCSVTERYSKDRWHPPPNPSCRLKVPKLYQLSFTGGDPVPSLSQVPLIGLFPLCLAVPCNGEPRTENKAPGTTLRAQSTGKGSLSLNCQQYYP